MQSHIVRMSMIAIITLMLSGFLHPILSNFLTYEGMSNMLRRIGMTVEGSAIMTGAISVCIAMLIVYYIDEYNKKKYGNIIKNPILDIIGFILGTYLYTLLI